MMIDKKSPDGKDFEAKLKEYEKQLNEFTGGKVRFESLAKAPKDIEIFKDDDDHVRKDFLTFTFENTPAIAALASVNQIETEILENESAALNYLAAEAGSRVLKVDKVVPMVRAKSSTASSTPKGFIRLSISLIENGSRTYFNGALFKNERKESDKQPDMQGSINLDNQPGGPKLRLAAWKKTGDKAGDYLSIAIQEYQSKDDAPAGSGPA